MTEAVKEQRKPAAEKDTRNDVTRPKAGTKTGQVWEIADRISGELGEAAPRREVMEQGVAAGVNGSTVATQYGRWRKYHGLVTPPRVAKVKPVVEEQEVDPDTTVGTDE